MMLAAAHGFPRRDAEIRRGVWNRGPLSRLAGKTLGLVGMGAIGKAMVPRARALDLAVIAHDPIPDREFAARNDVRLVSFEQLLAEADVVSLHLPCTPETVDLFNAETLGRMKPGAILVNTARGGLVDEDALVAALESGHLSAAALDVFKTEPLPAESPLARLENVLLCPHMGGLDCQSMEGMATMAAENIVRILGGDFPEGRVINPEVRQSRDR